LVGFPLIQVTAKVSKKKTKLIFSQAWAHTHPAARCECVCRSGIRQQDRAEFQYLGGFKLN